MPINMHHFYYRDVFHELKLLHRIEITGTLRNNKDYFAELRQLPFVVTRDLRGDL
jgi:hypothetical protein